MREREWTRVRDVGPGKFGTKNWNTAHITCLIVMAEYGGEKGLLRKWGFWSDTRMLIQCLSTPEKLNKGRCGKIFLLKSSCMYKLPQYNFREVYEKKFLQKLRIQPMILTLLGLATYSSYKSFINKMIHLKSIAPLLQPVNGYLYIQLSFLHSKLPPWTFCRPSIVCSCANLCDILTEVVQNKYLSWVVWTSSFFLLQ